MPEPIPQPANIPEHTLHHCIATGSYGEVWLAQNSTGTWRAVKIVRRDRFEHSRPFEREYRGIQEFEPVSREHPGLMQLLQVGRAKDDSFFYAVMELADDRTGTAPLDPATYHPRTLQSELDERGALPVDEVLDWGGAIAEALAFLHEQQLVHRDIKPANIIFVKGRPKLADIGLVSRLNTSFGHVGTHGYIPPEGLGHPPADVYALGKVLYEMITGRDRHAFPAPPEGLRLPDVSPELNALNEIVLNACEPNPLKRLQAGKLKMHLSQIEQGEFKSNNPWKLILASAMILIAVLVVFWPQTTNSLPSLQNNAKPINGLLLKFEFDGNCVEAGGHPLDEKGKIQYGPDRLGRPNAAAYFDGNGSKIILPPSSQLASITNLTVALWLLREEKRRDFEKYDYAGIIDRIPEPGFAFVRLWEGRPDFGTNKPYHQTVQPKAIPMNQWTHLAVVYDGENKIVFVNGEETCRDRVGAGALLWGNAGLRIGHEVSGSFKGWLDALHLYRRALLPNEIRELAK